MLFIALIRTPSAERLLTPFRPASTPWWGVQPQGGICFCIVCPALKKDAINASDICPHTSALFSEERHPRGTAEEPKGLL